MLFTFDTDAHLQHLLMTGENQHRKLECYNVYRCDWVELSVQRGLLYKDYEHSRICIVRERGMGDGECQGIGRAVRKCHSNLNVYGDMMIQVPPGYTRQILDVNGNMPYISDSEDEGIN